VFAAPWRLKAMKQQRSRAAESGADAADVGGGTCGGQLLKQEYQQQQ